MWVLLNKRVWGPTWQSLSVCVAAGNRTQGMGHTARTLLYHLVMILVYEPIWYPNCFFVLGSFSTFISFSPEFGLSPFLWFCACLVCAYRCGLTPYAPATELFSSRAAGWYIPEPVATLHNLIGSYPRHPFIACTIYLSHPGTASLGYSTL